ncbi:ABC transporter substrate-binding protein [Paenibacillus hodogayensis]
MHMKKWSLPLVFIFVLLMVSACGTASNKGTASQPDPAKTETPKDDSKQNSDSENTLAQIKKAGKIVIGTGGNYRPYNYMDNNNLVGYDIDWGNLIAEGLGVKVEYVTGEASGLIPGLVAKKFDIVMGGMSITEERKKTVDFSVPYSQDGIIAVIKKGSNAVDDLTNIAGKVVGANAGSSFEAAVKTIGGYKELKSYPGAPQSFTDLLAGRLDLVAIGKISATDYIKNSPFGKDLEIVGKPYDTKGVGVVIRQNNPELKAAIDKVIEDKKKDGTFDKLTNKHFGFTLDK